MAAMTAVLARSDFIRAPLLAAARPAGFKEWYHFVVHRPGWRLLVNFSLTSEASRAGSPQLTPRVIVIAHDQQWTGAIERFDDSELDVSADLGVMTVGGNRMTVRPDGYRVVIDLPGHDVRGELDLTSVSRPFAVNNQPVGDGRVSWLFVPLVACRRVAAHRTPGDPFRGQRGLSRPQLGPLQLGGRLRLDVGHDPSLGTR